VEDYGILYFFYIYAIINTNNPFFNFVGGIMNHSVSGWVTQVFPALPSGKTLFIMEGYPKMVFKELADLGSSLKTVLYPKEGTTGEFFILFEEKFVNQFFCFWKKR